MTLATEDCVFMAHLDGSGGIENQFVQCMKLFYERTNHIARCDTFLVGGYTCENDRWNRDVWSLLNSMASCQDIDFFLKLAFIGDLNTRLSPDGKHKKPKLYGCMWEIQNWCLVPADATRQTKKPLDELRHLRCFTGSSEMIEIFEPRSSTLRIPKFRFHRIGDAEFICRMPDAWILQNLSTSPHAEKLEYAEQTRRVMLFSLKCPPFQVLFGAKENVNFHWQDGVWATSDPVFSKLGELVDNDVMQ